MISYMMRLRPFDKTYHFLGANISSVISMFRVAYKEIYFKFDKIYFVTIIRIVNVPN